MAGGLAWFKSSYSDSEGGACVEVALSWRKSSHSDDQGGACVEVALPWQKSSHSDSQGGDCVEVALPWQKSSHSDSHGGACVEVAACAAMVHVRDSKDPEGPRLAFMPDAWAAFVTFASARASCDG
ncbi:DUF397 domain-containing protein [Streptomyces sp. PTM05]|uniref:DUF397 domain-containing protein n=1 Tax=Streptantibioticus parmotrematis TaxID=2873249 RepID=A0ABS7QL01_9ACTN|nr:DUF397 domain-containing protein [Streptantibioticus parmotrematis]MBY8883880.1 DUF397 domain-containing protein [Streptantibioticus parmotrematis]